MGFFKLMKLKKHKHKSGKERQHRHPEKSTYSRNTIQNEMALKLATTRLVKPLRLSKSASVIFKVEHDPHKLKEVESHQVASYQI